MPDGTDTFTYGYLDQAPNTLETITGPVHTVHLEYEDGRNAMTKVTNTETVGAQNLVSEYVYTYNKLGQRADRIQRGAGLITSKDAFSYDGLGHVTGSGNDVNTTLAAWNPVYVYDMIGNRDGNVTDLNGTVNYLPNLLNQYEQIATATPLYDLDGNMTSKGLWSYTWNGENRLIQATDGADTLIFEYDFQGRLISQTVNSGTAQHYLYDGWNRIASYTGSTLNQSYLWGLDLSGSPQGAGGVGGLLREGNYYPLYDANGNIMQKLDALGNEVMNVAYDPFGNIIDGSLVGEYGFSTKPLIENLDFYYYGFRYYDTKTGRWPSRDPIVELGGPNIYSFLGNSTLMYYDYLGMERRTPPDGWTEYTEGDLPEVVTEPIASGKYSIRPNEGYRGEEHNIKPTVRLSWWKSDSRAGNVAEAVLHTIFFAGNFGGPNRITNFRHGGDLWEGDNDVKVSPCTEIYIVAEVLPGDESKFFLTETKRILIDPYIYPIISSESKGINRERGSYSLINRGSNMNGGGYIGINHGYMKMWHSFSTPAIENYTPFTDRNLADPLTNQAKAFDKSRITSSYAEFIPYEKIPNANESLSYSMYIDLVDERDSPGWIKGYEKPSIINYKTVNLNITRE